MGIFGLKKSDQFLYSVAFSVLEGVCIWTFGGCVVYQFVFRGRDREASHGQLAEVRVVRIDHGARRSRSGAA